MFGSIGLQLRARLSDQLKVHRDYLQVLQARPSQSMHFPPTYVHGVEQEILRMNDRQDAQSGGFEAVGLGVQVSGCGVGDLMEVCDRAGTTMIVNSNTADMIEIGFMSRLLLSSLTEASVRRSRAPAARS